MSPENKQGTNKLGNRGVWGCWLEEQPNLISTGAGCSERK